MTVNKLNDSYRIVRVTAPEWFMREDFLSWLNSAHTATWHKKGEEPGEFSDAFVWFDTPRLIDGEYYCEGSDFGANPPDGMPEDIVQALAKVLYDEGAKCGLLWIDNLEE